MQQPEFWKQHNTIHSKLLRPVAALYQALCRLRLRVATSYQAQIPVICIGNVTVGGAGKTPTALAIGAMLQEMDYRPAFLSRGYGGSIRSATQVDAKHHSAGQVGDEPLLLSRLARTVVSRDRIDGVHLIQNGGSNVIIMDDGLQNPLVAKDLSFLVIDGGYGLGNGHVMPSGPLRETLADALARVDATIFIGEDATGLLPQLQSKPVLRATIVAKAKRKARQHYIAFAGIANPDKFFATLEQDGYLLTKKIAFDDHHFFTPEELASLHTQAKEKDAVLITTEKDFVRLPHEARAGIEALPVEIVFEQPDAMKNFLKGLKK